MLKLVVKDSSVNLLYGFFAGLPITAIVMAEQGYNDLIVLCAAVFYYQFLSVILNRKSYSTFLGKRIVFGIPTPLGFYLSYKFGEFIKTII